MILDCSEMIRLFEGPHPPTLDDRDHTAHPTPPNTLLGLNRFGKPRIGSGEPTIDLGESPIGSGEPSIRSIETSLRYGDVSIRYSESPAAQAA
jgi:hypothetical protein